MKILILAVAILLMVLRSQAASPVLVNANGSLAYPTNFFDLNTATDTNKLSKRGDGISGTFSLKNDLNFNGDTNAPNTNWIYSVLFENLDKLENSQTKTVSWYGKENMQLEGGIITITADTNLSFVTPNTRGVFTVPTNQWVLSLTGPADANGNVPADFIPLDNLSLTNSTFANKVD